MLGGFVSRAELVVIEGVFFPGVRGRQVGHHHVGSRLDAQLPALGMDGTQGGGGGQQYLRQGKPHQSQQDQGVLQGARPLLRKGGVLLGDEGPQAHHVGLELLEEAEVLRQGVRSLARGAYHESGSHLVADVLQGAQAVHPVGQGKLRGVQSAVVDRVGGLVAEQIPVGSGVKPQLIGLPVELPQGEGHGAVRKAALDGRHGRRHPVWGKPRVLSGLEHEGAEAPAVALLAAGQDGVPVQPVAGHMAVVPPDSAI